MEVVSILRQLWRRRLIVAVGVAVALTAGVLIAYRVEAGVPPRFESRQYQVGIASAEVLVDSHSSQIIDLGGGPLRTDIVALTARARLLANIMAASPMKDQIARRAGIDPRTFSASAPSLGPDALKPASLDSSPAALRPNVMTVYYNETLPIVTADAQAADQATAARISSAAIAELGSYLETVAAQDKVPDARQLVIDPLGPARFATVERGARRRYAIVAFLFVLGLWCTAIVLISGLARNWRDAAAADRGSDGAPFAGADGGSAEPSPGVARAEPREAAREHPREPPAQEPPPARIAPDLPGLPRKGGRSRTAA